MTHVSLGAVAFVCLPLPICAVSVRRGYVHTAVALGVASGVKLLIASWLAWLNGAGDENVRK